MKRNLSTLLTAAGALLVSSVSHAMLIDRGNGHIYDDTFNITWLQDANTSAGPAAGSGIPNTNGLDNWANTLVFGESDIWQRASITGGLPAGMGAGALVVDCGAAALIDCDNDELGYVYLTSVGGRPPTGLLTNPSGHQDRILSIQSFPWGGSKLLLRFLPVHLPPQAYVLGVGAGGANGNAGGNATSGPGSSVDVAVSEAGPQSIPEPGTWLLFGAGLASLVFTRRRRSRV